MEYIQAVLGRTASSSLPKANRLHDYIREIIILDNKCNIYLPVLGVLSPVMLWLRIKYSYNVRIGLPKSRIGFEDGLWLVYSSCQNFYGIDDNWTHFVVYDCRKNMNNIFDSYGPFLPLDYPSQSYYLSSLAELKQTNSVFFYVKTDQRI